MGKSGSAGKRMLNPWVSYMLVASILCNLGALRQHSEDQGRTAEQPEDRIGKRGKKKRVMVANRIIEQFTLE